MRLVRPANDRSPAAVDGVSVVDTDGDLIPRLAAGDEAALGELMDRHMTHIHAIAYRMLGDVFMAEDVTQTVFLKTWRMCPDWQPGRASLKTWMRRVATNQCLDVLRKKRPQLMAQVPDIQDERAGPLESLQKSQRAHRMKTALARLPDRQRAALTLSYYENVSQKEGAAALDISVAAYESLLARARRALKNILETTPQPSQSLGGHDDLG